MLKSHYEEVQKKNGTSIIDIDAPNFGAKVALSKWKEAAFSFRVFIAPRSDTGSRT
jgi:hypothetical protein